MNKLLLGCAIGALTASAAYAQETTSTIRGSVDAAGAPVAGATVTVTHEPSGTVSTQVTNSDGSFNASGLRVGGPFSVRVSASGYPDRTVSDLFLTAGQPLRVPVSFDDTEIVVTGRRNTTELSVGPITSITREGIEGIATVNRDIRDIARRDAFTTIDPTTRGIEIAGQNARLNKFSVDGVNFNDQYGLNLGGLPTARGPVPIDAIEQLAVKVAPYDIAEGNFQGGAVNVVLRSGNNDLTGSAFYAYSDDKLTGDKTRNTNVNLDFDSKNFGGFLSGAIIRDKLFFAVAYERLEEGAPVENNPDEVPGFNQGLLDRISVTAQSRYGYETQGILRTAQEKDEKITAKVDWNISDTQRISATYIRNEGTRGQQIGVSNNVAAPTIGFQSNSYLLAEEVNSGVIQLNSAWSDSFSTQIRANYRKYDRAQTPYGGLSQGQFTVCTDTTSRTDVANFLLNCNQGSSAAPGNIRAIFGADPSRQANSLKAETWGGDISATWSQGDHSLKAIVGWTHQKVFNIFAQNALGTYYFDTIGDYEAGRANGLVLAGSTSGDINDVAADYEYDQFSFSLQDSWDITDRINVTYGARYDLFAQTDRPAVNTGFVNRYGFSNNLTFTGRGVLQPRLGATWNVTDRLVLRAGGGLFSGQPLDVWLANSFQNSGVFLNQITINRTPTGFSVTGLNAAQSAAIGAAALNNVQGGTNFDPLVTTYLQSNAQAASINAIDPNFKIPSLWKASISASYEADLGPLGDDWLFGGDLFYGAVNRTADFVDLRSVRTGTAPDGRPRYTASIAGVNQDLLLTNDKRGRSYIAVARVQKTFDFGLTAGLTYTYQDIKDVNSTNASTAGSNYGQNAMLDPNSSAYGTSNYQYKHSFKFNYDYNHAFFGDYNTRFSLFAERRSGRPYSLTMIDLGSTGATRSPVFGTAGQNNRYLLYVPNVSSETADPLVSYAPGTFSAFQNFIQSNGLEKYSGSIIPKNTQTSPIYWKVDLHVDQEIPAPFFGRFKIYADLENVLNFIDKDLGSFRQVNFPYLASPVAVSCATTSGPNCTKYQYSSFQNPNIVNTTRLSLWQLRVGAKFEF